VASSPLLMSDTTEPQPGVEAARRPGDLLTGRFRLEARLGRGGFGDVWRASELLPDGSVVREIALKLMAPEHASADWAREAKVLASLRHRALVTVFSAGILEVNPPTPFVAMELLEGRSLSEALAEQGAVPWRRSLAFVREIAGALDAIHEQGIIHLDLKPSNLQLGPDGVVRVLDFGIARHRAQPPPSLLPSPGADDNASLGTGALLDLEGDEPGPRSSSRAGAPRPGAGLGAPAGGRIVGTPGFMAPEVLEGKEPSPSSDAYALGACLFQLLTGRLPQRARQLVPRGSTPDQLAAWRAEIRASTVAGDLLAPAELLALAPRTPAGVVALCYRLLALDPAQRPPPTTLAGEAEEAWQRPHGTPVPPYLGLRAYGQEAEGFLFGREADSERLGRELTHRPVLVLQGASGSGKSSLAVAGVTPALARAFVDGRDDWVAAVVRPGQDIDAAVRRARELGAGAPGPASPAGPAGAAGAAAADAARAAARGARVGVVLVIDQLEELVTQLGAEQKARFVLALLRHASPGGEPAPGEPPRTEPGLRVVCTLREDFTTRVAALGSLGRLLEDAVRFVPPPSAASVRDIVVGPAELAGVRVDDERPVVDDVLKELRSGEGRLPLVSFALSEWWQTREGATDLRGQGSGRSGAQVLTSASWRRIGGVAGALSRHADHTLATLPAEARAAARDLLLRLVTPEGTRARVPEREIRASGPHHARALDAFIEARLITIDDAASASFSHEALLVAWGSLAVWVEEERADRVEAAGLDALAKLWRAAGPGGAPGASGASGGASGGAAASGDQAEQRDELLLRGTRLTRALELQRARPDLVAPFADLIRASRSRNLRERVVKNSLALLLLGASAAAVVFYGIETRKHDLAIRVREENLKQLVVQYEEKQREEQKLAESLAQRAAELGSLRQEIKGCRDNLVRVEQEHRASLSERFYPGSFEHKVVAFLLAWEHVWNVHDPARMTSFFTPEVQWFGFEGPRDELIRSMERSWRQSPNNRLLIGEASVTHKPGEDETHVRMTREERTGGTLNLAVTHLVIRGDKPDNFALERGSVEKVIVSGKPLGCPLWGTLTRWGVPSGGEKVYHRRAMNGRASNNMPKVKSCGVLIFRDGQPRQFLLMRHPGRYDLPKGHVEGVETEMECAMRELREETGIQPDNVSVDPGFRYTETYYPRYKRFGGRRVEKTLVIFLASLGHDVPITVAEHEGWEWVPWSPPHQLQRQTVDPLLASVESYWASKLVAAETGE
jgi:serine/threonine protein kinase/8-oxo-dGTP pyrophosphatase MutT (NUDIX family)/predicted transcriptional regulator